VLKGQAEKKEQAPTEKIPFWHDPDKLAIVYQGVALALVLGFGYYLFYNAQANLARQNISTGFGFLHQQAGFDIGESMIAYSAADTYARALAVGLLNTLKVSLLGIILTVVLGIVVGVARLSTNWLVSRLAAIYIEVLQNIPVLLQLFFWYALFHSALPSPRQSLHPLPGVVFNNRGFYYPLPVYNSAYAWMGVAFVLALIAGWVLRRWARRRQELTGAIFPAGWVSFGLAVVAPSVTWAVCGAPTKMNIPHLVGFNFVGGINFSPEFGALLLGLVLYTSAFVAEIVRSGIQAITKGQTEAAMSLGLKPGRVLTLVILPQALRIIIPPLTSQMLNLIKNSSLAIAIGYPDIVAVANTTINQTGQAIEGVALIMAAYLFFSLLTSAIMNWYNKKKALIER
jgi:general L-amino acid transport system permease protein